MARATSGKTLAVFLAAAVWSASCSAPHRSAAPRACLGPVPAAWAHPHSGVRAAHLTFGVGAVAGDTAYGQFEGSGRRGIGALDLRTGRLSAIASYATGVSGMGAIAVEAPWIVWEQLDSTSNLDAWSVHAANLTTGVHRVLAAAQPGTHGLQPLPVLRHGIAAWAQPVPGGEAELVAVDLAGDTRRVLDTGRVTSPAYAGADLVWGKADRLYAVDALSLQPAELPAGMRDPGAVGYVGGSPDYLVWSGPDGLALSYWQFSTGRRGGYELGDGRHFFQFLQVAGDYLVWFSGSAASVLDLSTGKGFDLPGTIAGAGDAIAVASREPDGASRVSRWQVAAAAHIATC